MTEAYHISVSILLRINWNYVDFREARFRGIDEDKSSKGMIVVG